MGSPAPRSHPSQPVGGPPPPGSTVGTGRALAGAGAGVAAGVAAGTAIGGSALESLPTLLTVALAFVLALTVAGGWGSSVVSRRRPRWVRPVAAVGAAVFLLALVIYLTGAGGSDLDLTLAGALVVGVVLMLLVAVL